jgi:hypothetical protein
MQSKAKIVKLITAVIAAVFVYLISSYRGFDFSYPLKANLRALSDGAFVVGLIFTGVGLLSVISQTGFFDIFTYALYGVITFATALRRPKDSSHYYEYKQMKEKKRKSPVYFVLYYGIFWIAVSALSLWGYYSL